MIVVLDHGRVQIVNRAVRAPPDTAARSSTDANWFEVVVPRARYPRAYEGFLEMARAARRSLSTRDLDEAGELRLVSWRSSALRTRTTSATISIRGRHHGIEESAEEQGGSRPDRASRPGMAADLRLGRRPDPLLDAQGRVLRANRAVTGAPGRPFADI